MTDKGKRDYDELQILIQATDAGKSGAAQKLRKFLDAHPWFKKVGDVHTNLMGILMDKLTENQASNHEFLSAHIDEQKQSLGHAEARGLERMLIERVVMCWLRLTLAECYCNKIGGSVTTIKEAEFAERSLTRANSRFIQAGEALERYRLMAEAAKMAKAKADLLEAKAEEAKMNKPNAAMRLVQSATG